MVGKLTTYATKSLPVQYKLPYLFGNHYKKCGVSKVIDVFILSKFCTFAHAGGSMQR